VVRIFLADDMPAVREVLRAGLEAAAGRYRVVGEAADGERALLAIAATKPDVIILDLDMPGLDGCAVVHRLRSMGDATPVILCSSWGRETGPLPPGIALCLQKPFRIEALVQAVDETVATLVSSD
jgi:CheY-like chemotaxis protein